MKISIASTSFVPPKLEAWSTLRKYGQLKFLNYGDNSKDSLILENREWANKLKCLRSDSTLMGGEASKRFIFPNTLNELKSLYSKTS